MDSVDRLLLIVITSSLLVLIMFNSMNIKKLKEAVAANQGGIITLLELAIEEQEGSGQEAYYTKEEGKKI